MYCTLFIICLLFLESIKEYFEQWGPVESVALKKNKDDPTKHR